MNRPSTREHGVYETANSNRATPTRLAPITLPGRCSDDSSRPDFVADGPSTAPFAQCWPDQTSRCDRTKPNGCAARPTRATVAVVAPTTGHQAGRAARPPVARVRHRERRSVRQGCAVRRAGGRAGPSRGRDRWRASRHVLAFAARVSRLQGPAGRTDSAPRRSRSSASDIPAKVAQIVGAGPNVLSALNQLYVGGKPRTAQPADAMQVLAVRLVRLAHSWETAHQRHGRAGAAALIRRNAGSELDPRLAAVFVAEEPALLAAIDDPADLRSISRDRTGPRRLRGRA